MSPKSLLFSSDQETSRLVGQTLSELGLKVESSAEIFAALRSLTSRIFDLIVVDWDEGPEASFLLKTARDLKSNRGAFVIVIGRAEASAALEHAGGNLVLSKPINVDRVRHDLLTSKDFLARVKSWLPQGQPRQTTATAQDAGREPWPMRAPAPGAMPAARVAPASYHHGSASDSAANLTFASFDDDLLGQSPLQRIFQPDSKATSRSPKGLGKAQGFRKGVNSRTALLRITAIVIAFFVLGYVFSQPLTRARSSLTTIASATWERTLASRRGAPVEVQAAELEPTESQRVSESASTDEAPAQTWQGESSASGRIRVTPVGAVPVAHPQQASGTPSAATRAEGASEPSQDSAMASRAPIPESLSSPFPGVATVRNVASKITPALLNALQPITVPEQLSEKLLLDKVEPNYPQKALEAGLQGPVVLQAWIGTDGRIRDLKLIRGSLLLGQAACDAVKQWRYKPYLLNGQAVEAQTFVTVDFKLP